jgi:hypothetical protein
MINIFNDMKFVFLAIALAIFTQALTTDIAILTMGESFISMSLVIFLALIAKHYIPSPLPTFAYATIIGIVICLPDTIVRTFLLDSIGKISFLSCCVPLLAFAGLSVGGKMEELKKMSWKIILLFLLVSTCCFFGAAIVAQIGFSIQGII